MSARLDEIAAELVSLYGPDPQAVGAADGSEDDWVELVHEAAVRLGRDPSLMSDEDWGHFQDVASACQATTMDGWLAHLEAIS